MTNGGGAPPIPKPPDPVVKVSRPATSGDTVTVACKLPHGVILRIFRWEEFEEQMRDGTYKTSKIGRPQEGREFVVRGTWAASAGQAYNVNNSAVAELLPGGYALTHGCPKDLWDEWFVQNMRSLLVRNKIVFAHSAQSAATEQARELRSVKSGMEPLDPQRPAERMPGGVDRRLRMGILDRNESTG
jgi:hypothetical protein